MKGTNLRSIARRYGLRTIILFGSRARGTARRGSDCDISVSAPEWRGDELDLVYELSRALRQDVDLCRFERIGPSLMYTVATEGKLLYGSRDDFDRLRLRAIREWQDSGKSLGVTAAYLDRVLS